MPAPEVYERARLYLAKMDPACSGQYGHAATFKAACALVRGFDLDEESTFQLLWEEHNPVCCPPWSERELRHKVRDAFKVVGERGVLLKEEERSCFPSSKRTPPLPHVDPVTRPPGGEVAALWEASGPVCDDSEVDAWLLARGLDPLAVTDFDLCRALPGGALPGWARYRGKPWGEIWHRALFPMYSAAGILESFHTRAIDEPAVKAAGIPKALAPSGNDSAGRRFGVKGLVFADPLARLLLQTGEAPRWWEGEHLVIVAEGEPNWMTWATRYSDADKDAPAVFGVIAGSWNEEIAARVPGGCRVSVRTDADAAGQKYADKICRTLAGRCRVARVKGQE